MMDATIAHQDLERALNSLSSGILVTDAVGGLLYWNQAAKSLLNLDKSNIGVSADSFFPTTGESSGWAAEMLAALQSPIVATSSMCAGAAKYFWSKGTINAIYDERSLHCGFVKTFYDASHERREEIALATLARTDALTGLANRPAFDAKLRECAAAGARSDQVVILHLIDLDRFKQVNDTLGHQAGDELLREVATRLRKIARKTDFIARLGGDEFALLQFGPSETVNGGILAEKILGQMSETFEVSGSEAQISASVGIAVLPVDSTLPNELLRMADAALYRVKNDGRDGYSFFTVDLDRRAHERGSDIAALKEAMRSDQFHLVYQPKVCALSGSLLGMEALLRCHHPDLKDRPTFEVVELAKSCGVMKSLTEWILLTACKQTAEWFGQGLPRFKLCVNFCAKELSDISVVGVVDNALIASGLQPAELVIELTEADLFDSGGVGVEMLKLLRERGITIALDDFGTGYSSLSYLATLPVDLIKLDISFVRALSSGPQGAKVIHGIIGLAQSLDLEIVAEGIENDAELQFFKNIGEIAVQGFYICRPLTTKAMSAWLAQ